MKVAVAALLAIASAFADRNTPHMMETRPTLAQVSSSKDIVKTVVSNETEEILNPTNDLKAVKELQEQSDVVVAAQQAENALAKASALLDAGAKAAKAWSKAGEWWSKSEKEWKANEWVEKSNKKEYNDEDYKKELYKEYAAYYHLAAKYFAAAEKESKEASAASFELEKAYLEEEENANAATH